MCIDIEGQRRITVVLDVKLLQYLFNLSTVTYSYCHVELVFDE